MTTKLTIYNGAARDLGERALASLSESRESRRVFDSSWDTGLCDLALSSGQWNFATRTVKIEYSTDVSLDFGFSYAFEKPSDWIRTVAISGDERFSECLNDYDDNGAYFFADLETIYVKYVSNDTSYGGNLSLWPINFARYVESLLAFETCERITQSATKKKETFALMEERLSKAKNTDAMNESVKFLPQGNWSKARFGSGTSTRFSGGRQF